MPYKRKEDKREYDKRYAQEHKEEIKTYMKKWRAENKERRREYYWNNRDKDLRGQKRYRRRIKAEVLTYYGGNKLRCIKCGVGDLRVLSIDHIDGGGTRKGEWGTNFYLRLRKDGFPDGYQTLCMNCQKIKQHENNEWGNQHTEEIKKWQEQR